LRNNQTNISMKHSIRLFVLLLCLALTVNVSAQDVANNCNFKRCTHFGFEGSLLCSSGATAVLFNKDIFFGELSANVGYSWGDGLYVGFDIGSLFCGGGALLNPALAVKYNFKNEKISPFVKAKVGPSLYLMNGVFLYHFGSLAFGLDFSHFSAYMEYFNVNITSVANSSVGLLGIGVGYNF